MITNRSWGQFMIGIAVAILVAAHAQAADKVINITGSGNDAQFIEDGKTKQLNVLLKVGDKVRWKNNGDKTHTATSDFQVGEQRLFGTGNINAGNSSAVIDITQDFYDKAAKAMGTKPGQQVHLGYFCEKHQMLMGGKLVITPANFREIEHQD